MPYQFTCKQCGMPFVTQRPKAQFCNRTCMNTYRAGRADERFWQRVDKSGECWVWIGFVGNNGYGQFYNGGAIVRAHRFAWELTHGPIPDGLLVLHNCPDGDNPACVNPSHLWLGTNDENMADMVAKGRQAAGERHGRARLTKDIVIMIRNRYHIHSDSIDTIADAFGVSPTHVRSIIDRERWKHIA